MSEQLAIETLERICGRWSTTERELTIVKPKKGDAVDQQGWTLSVTPTKARLFEPGSLLDVAGDTELELYYTQRSLVITHFQGQEAGIWTLGLAPNAPAANLAGLFPMLANAAKRKREAATDYGLALCRAILAVCLEQTRHPTRTTPGKAARRVETFYALDCFISESLPRAIGVRDAAAALSKSGRYLNEVCNDFRSMTFSQYLNLRRLERARRLLLTDPSPKVKELALGCGFHSVDYFVRRFRKTYGVPPGQLRKCLKRPDGRRNPELHRLVDFDILTPTSPSGLATESEDLPQVTLMIINTRSPPADVYWLSPQGVMQAEGKLAAGGRWIMGVSRHNVICVREGEGKESFFKTADRNCQILL